jgi:hypothetical protein
MYRHRNRLRNISAGLGVTALAVSVALVGAAGSASADETAQNPPGVPAPGSAAGTWEAWAADERADAEATDWAADSAARGCELIDVTITDEVDVGYNRAMGAPDGLSTHRVDLEEDCSDASMAVTEGAATKDGSARAVDDGAAAYAVPSGNRCSSTTGPGTMCLSKSSGRIYASWKYSGSGSVSGFIRVYRISSSSSGCPTGSTWLTGSESTWSSGTTRTISKSAGSYGGYSSHFWKKVTIGHTNWGGTCAVL